MDDFGDVIPICDARAVLDSEWLALLAAARPQSDWVTACRCAERRPGFALTSLFAMAQAERMPAHVPPPALVVLSEMDVKPHAKGDDVGFCAEVDLSPGWAGWYRRWRRSWSSPEPSVLTNRRGHRPPGAAAAG